MADAKPMLSFRAFSDEELFAVIEQLLNDKEQLIETAHRLWPIQILITQRCVQRSDREFLERVTHIIYRESGKQAILRCWFPEMCLSQSQLNRRIKAATGLTTSNMC